MADSTSPEPQSAAAPSALTDPATGTGHRRSPTPGHRPLPVLVPVPGRKPLPDAVAIQMVAVPDGAPPYDGAPPVTHHDPSADSDPADVSAAIAAVASLNHTAARRSDQGQFAGHWPSQFAQVLAETLAGSRPPSQLAPWTTQQTRRRINQLGLLLSTAHRPRIKRVVVTSPAGGVLEMAVIVGVGNRVRALAVRLERAPAAPADGSAERLAVDLTPTGQLPAARQQTAPHGWICTAIEAA